MAQLPVLAFIFMECTILMSLIVFGSMIVVYKMNGYRSAAGNLRVRVTLSMEKMLTTAVKKLNQIVKVNFQHVINQEVRYRVHTSSD